jgi:hypothetical protein
MASRAIHMGGASAPLDLMLASIPSLPRPLLSRLVHRMIERLDNLDGDSDLELAGDETDGSLAAEDEFQSHYGYLPGCPVSDPAEPDDEDRCEAADDGCAPVYFMGRVHWGADPEAGL